MAMLKKKESAGDHGDDHEPHAGMLDEDDRSPSRGIFSPLCRCNASNSSRARSLFFSYALSLQTRTLVARVPVTGCMVQTTLDSGFACSLEAVAAGGAAGA